MRCYLRKLSIFVAIALLLSGCSDWISLPPDDGDPGIPQEGLKAYFPFTGDAMDHSGNEFHGTVEGATLSTDRLGKSNAAYRFDGDDNINLGDVMNDIDIPFSVSAWIHASNPPEDKPFPRIFGSDLPAYYLERKWDYAGFWLALGRTGVGIIKVQFGNGQGFGEQFRRGKRQSPTTVPMEEWVHVSAVVQGASNMRLYVGGREVAGELVGYASEMAHNSAPARIGLGFRGRIDEVAIYDRALSATEVSSLAES